MTPDGLRPVLTAYCTRCDGHWLQVYRRGSLVIAVPPKGERRRGVALLGMWSPPLPGEPRDGIDAPEAQALRLIVDEGDDSQVPGTTLWRHSVLVPCGCGREPHIARPFVVRGLLARGVTKTDQLDHLPDDTPSAS